MKTVKLVEEMIDEDTSRYAAKNCPQGREYCFIASGSIYLWGRWGYTLCDYAGAYNVLEKWVRCYGEPKSMEYLRKLKEESHERF